MPAQSEKALGELWDEIIDDVNLILLLTGLENAKNGHFQRQARLYLDI